MKYLVLLGFGIGAVLVYLLSSASANTELFARNFPYLLAVTGALVTALLVLVGYQIIQLRHKIKYGVFGAKLTVRLMLVFGLMALLPGAVVYGVSVQFLSKSIESWFDVRVDNALGSGLNLGQAVLDNLQRELTKKAESMALALADQPPAAHIHLLNTLREQSGVQEATLFSERGKIIAFAGNERAGMLRDDSRQYHPVADTPATTLFPHRIHPRIGVCLCAWWCRSICCRSPKIFACCS